MVRTVGIVCLIAWCGAAAAMVGGAPPAAPEVARPVVMIVGSRGNSCTGVAIARDLVLTAAHCVLPGADYKLVELDAAAPARLLKDMLRVARHPQFSLKTMLCAPRHRRRRADQAREAAGRVRAGAADASALPGRGRRALHRARLRRLGARRRQQRRHAARGDAGRHRPAGQPAAAPGRSGDRRQPAPGSAPAPAISARRSSTRPAAPRPDRRGELVDRPQQRAPAAAASPA